MLTMCPQRDRALSLVPAASAAAAADTAPRDPARAVTPDGTPRYRNAGRRVRPSLRTPRNNRDERTSAGKNLRPWALGADPRAPRPRQLTPTALPAPAVAAGNADSGHGAALDLGYWHGSADWPASAATAQPRRDTPRCNSALVAGVAETTVRTPSTGSAGSGSAGHQCSRPRLALDPGRLPSNLDVDPRELALPDGQASEGSANFSPGRFSANHQLHPPFRYQLGHNARARPRAVPA